MGKRLKLTPKPPYDIFCQYTDMLETKLLVRKKHPENPNKHSEEQIGKLAIIMRKNGVRNPIVMSNLSGYIIKGHGRLEAALMNGWDHFPVQFQDYGSEADEVADMIADNKIQEFSELDMDAVKTSLDRLGKDLSLDRLGMDLETIEENAGTEVSFQANKKPKKIECPKCQHKFKL